MAGEVRKTGIDPVGDVPWGTHFCQFYQTKQDLIDTLVPYFKAGLANNEFCMWVLAESLSKEEASKAMAKAVPDFSRYLARGQMEILPHTEWYLKDGKFDAQRVFNSWMEKLNQVLAKGFDGIRVTDNSSWSDKTGWKSFNEYEATVRSVIGGLKMLALCTYRLDKYRAAEMVDVVSNHEFALIKKEGRWDFFESSDYKKTKEALRTARDELEIRIQERTRELGEANRRFADVLDALPVYLVLLSPDYHVPFANRFFRERFGESHGKRCFEYLWGRTEPCEVCETYKVLKTMKPLEWEWTGPDGRNYYILDFPLTDTDGSTLIMETGIDITKLKQTETALRRAHDELEMRVQERTRELEKSEDKYRHIVETANEGIWTADPQGNILFVNQRMAQMLGYSVEEMTGRNTSEFREKGQEPQVLTQRAKLRQGMTMHDEIKFRHKDDSILWMATNASPIFDAEGNHIANMAMLTDITERKRAEEALAREKELLQTIVENTDALLAYFDPDFNFVRVNSTYARSSGHPARELIGKNHFELFPDEENERIFRQVRDTGKAVAFHDKPFEYKDQPWRGVTYWDWTLTPVKDAYGHVQGLILSLVDTTARVRLENEMRIKEQAIASSINAIVMTDLQGQITYVNPSFMMMWGG